MSTLVAGLWSAVVLTGAWLVRPAPTRLRLFVAASQALRGPMAGSSGDPAGVAGRRSWARSPVGALGAVARRLLRRAPDAGADGRLGWLLLGGSTSVLVAPPMLVVVVLVWWAVPVLGRRRADRRRDSVLLDELPEAVDLLVLAVGAGLTVPLAVRAVARHQTGLIGGAFDDVVRRVALGARLGDTLADLPVVLGDRARRLSAVLVSSERYGIALLPALERLAAETRLERRRRAEAAARRVPVKLLFPLVLCTLPAFALLTVVPLLAGSLRSLRL